MYTMSKKLSDAELLHKHGFKPYGGWGWWRKDNGPSVTTVQALALIANYPDRYPPQG